MMSHNVPPSPSCSKYIMRAFIDGVLLCVCLLRVFKSWSVMRVHGTIVSHNINKLLSRRYLQLSFRHENAKKAWSATCAAPLLRYAASFSSRFSAECKPHGGMFNSQLFCVTPPSGVLEEKVETGSRPALPRAARRLTGTPREAAQQRGAAGVRGVAARARSRPSVEVERQQRDAPVVPARGEQGAPGQADHPA